MKTAFLVTPKSEISGWVHEIDRAYFSKPVLVEIVSDENGEVIVKDHARDHTYPVDRKYLKSKYQLTNAQRAACEGASNG